MNTVKSDCQSDVFVRPSIIVCRRT